LLWFTRFTETSPARAAALLAPLLAGPDAPRLAILGEEVDEGDRRALTGSLAAAGVERQVDWLGYDPALLQRFVAEHAGDVVAIYPLDDDPTNRARCPAKVPELMALGVPIVAEAVGELRSFLRGFEGQCLVPADSQQEFRSRVRSLSSDHDARAALAHRLREAATSWTWDRMAGPLLDWYLRSRGAPSGP
jgi:glycosyltransferase involved in cell wall biosynthesis